MGRLTKPRIIVADDHPLFRQQLVLLLAAEFNVVAAAADGKLALDLIRRFHPDLVVLDLRMPRMNGIEVTMELNNDPQSPRVVICSGETEPEIVEVARQVGAIGFVFKERVKEDLIPAMKLAAQGKPFLSPQPRMSQKRSAARKEPSSIRPV